MIKTIRPHGAIREDLVSSIAIERPGRYILIDTFANRYGIDEKTFNKLKGTYKEITLHRKEN